MNILRKLQRLLSTNWGILFALSAVCFAVMSPVLLFHRTTIFVNLDNVDQFYAWYQKLSTSWHNGYLPIWNANVYSGSSFAGELQQGVLYPVNWLWVALFGSAKGISELALNYLVTLHFVIAAFGCYLLLCVMKARRWSAFAGSLVFAFSGALAMRSVSQTVIFFALAYVPYPLYFLLKHHTNANHKKLNLALAGGSLGFILLVGHIQPFFHAALALLLIELLFIKRQFTSVNKLVPILKDSLKNGIAVGLFAVLVALPQLWVSASYLPNAYRVQASGYVAPGVKISYEEFAKSFNLQPHEFANMIDPASYPVRDGNDPFIGLVSLVILVIALVIARKRYKETQIWQKNGDIATAFIVLSVLAMVGYVTWFAVVLYKLPLVYQIRQLGRYVVLFDLGLAVCVTSALEALKDLKLTKQQRLWLGGVAGFLLLQFIYLFLLRRAIFGTHLALQYAVCASFLLVGVFAARFRKELLVISLVATVVVNGFWFLPKLKPDTKTAKSYKLSAGLIKTLEQTNGEYRVGSEEDALPVNIGNVHNFQTTMGYSATIEASYYEFSRSGKFDPNFVNDVLGVKYMVGRSVRAADRVVYSDKQQKISVVERPSALPKFFVTKRERSTVRSDYEGLKTETQAYNDQYQRYAVDVPRSGTVIASELFYPGWVAKVDGKDVSISEYTIGDTPLLKQLVLPAGKHTVEFLYKPFVLF